VATELGNGVLGAADDFWVVLAQAAVDFQELGAARVAVAHQLVGPRQAAKALDVSGRTEQCRGLVDDEARQAPAFGVQGLEGCSFRRLTNSAMGRRRRRRWATPSADLALTLT
jgi:hypothetical protein